MHMGQQQQGILQFQHFHQPQQQQQHYQQSEEEVEPAYATGIDLKSVGEVEGAELREMDCWGFVWPALKYDKYRSGGESTVFVNRGPHENESSLPWKGRCLMSHLEEWSGRVVY